MVNFKEEIAKIISGHIDGLSEQDIYNMIEIPQDSKMGDYAFPCFKPVSYTHLDVYKRQII